MKFIKIVKLQRFTNRSYSLIITVRIMIKQSTVQYNLEAKAQELLQHRVLANTCNVFGAPCTHLQYVNLLGQHVGLFGEILLRYALDGHRSVVLHSHQFGINYLTNKPYFDAPQNLTILSF